MKQRPEYYRLEGHEVVPCDAWEWARNFRDFPKWRIGWTELDTTHVSTVFLGLDHGRTGGPLEIFETMVFGGGEEWDEYCERYATWEEAQAGHERIIRELESNGSPGDFR